MKLEGLRDKKRLISVCLLGVAVFFAAGIAVEATSFFVDRAAADKLVKDTVAKGKPDPDVAKKQLAKAKESTEEIKKKNLFAPPPPKSNPVNQVSGIMGDEALINGKWYKAGAKIGDATVVAVEPTLVRIEWEGKERVFAPITAAGAARPERRGRERPDSNEQASRVPDSEEQGRRRPERIERRGRPPAEERGREVSEQDRERRARFEEMREKRKDRERGRR